MRASNAWVFWLGLMACGEPGMVSREPQVLYRGQHYSPLELEALGLQVHHLAVTPELIQHGLIAGFDSEEEAVAYSWPGPDPMQGPSLASTPCESRSSFHDRVHTFTDPSFSLAPGDGLLSLWDIAGENWHGRISALRVFNCPGTLTLYSLPDFEGKTITFSQNTMIGSLSEYILGPWHSWSNASQSIRSISSFEFSARDTAGARRNTASLRVELRAGQIIQLGTCGVAGASGRGDTYLRLYDARGKQVAANDDLCGAHAFLSYTVPTGGDGAHELHAGCFGDTECGGTVAYTFFASR
ncbi:MAG TPA: hypothetical protein VF815_21525 [Myxococcaceae bacterium]|jgi:hypothetical protein